MRLATLCLTSCSGCHIALLHHETQMVDLLASGKIVYSPLLMDVKEPPECDVALVEGCIRNQEDEEKIKRLREKSRALISLGTCAVYGGIAGLGNAYSREELVRTRYTNPPTQPALEPRVLPIDAVVNVDWYVPGCPPPPHVLEMLLDGFIKGTRPTITDLPVCAECPRIVRGEFSREVKRTYENKIDPEECLLQQGFVCLGSVTRAGCQAVCTEAGSPCIGCRGPTQRLLLEASHGVFEDWVKRRCHYLHIRGKDAQQHLTNLKHCLYLFTLSAPFMRRRKSERTAELIYRVNVDETNATTGKD